MFVNDAIPRCDAEPLSGIPLNHFPVRRGAWGAQLDYGFHSGGPGVA
jgi:hypothetical protein